MPDERVEALLEEHAVLIGVVAALTDRVAALEREQQRQAGKVATLKFAETAAVKGPEYCPECNSIVPLHFDNCPRYVAPREPEQVTVNV